MHRSIARYAGTGLARGRQTGRWLRHTTVIVGLAGLIAGSAMLMPMPALALPTDGSSYSTSSSPSAESLPTIATAALTARPLLGDPAVAGLDSVSCSSASDCVAVGFASGLISEVISTDDGGSNWSIASIPGGVFVGQVSCASMSEACVAVGATKDNVTSPGAIIFSGNGGATWGSSAPLPAGTGEVYAISCSSADDCFAIANSTSSDTVPPFVLYTVDGGADWARAAGSLPGGMLAVGLSCASGSDCVVVGTPNGASGEVAYTTTGGSTWTAGTVPSGLAALSSASCTSTVDCVAVQGANGMPGGAISTTDGGSTWTRDTMPDVPGSLGSVSCPPSTDQCVAVTGNPYPGGAVYSSDGGADWTAGTVPSGIPLLTSVSCPNVSDCIAVGLGGSSQPAVISSTDGGETWAPLSATPASPANVTAVAGSGYATVTWSESGTWGVTAPTSYTVTSSRGQSTTVTGSPPATTAIVSGLPTNGTSETFTVTASNGNGDASSGSSNAVEALPSGNVVINNCSGLSSDVSSALEAVSPALCGTSGDITITSQQNTEIYDLVNGAGQWLLQNLQCSSTAFTASQLSTAVQEDLESLQDANATTVEAFVDSAMTTIYDTQNVAKTLQDLDESADSCAEILDGPQVLLLLGGIGIAVALTSIPQYSYAFSTGSSIASPGSLTPGESISPVNVSVEGPTADLFLYAFQGQCLFNPVLALAEAIVGTSGTNPCTASGVTVSDAPVLIGFASTASPPATAAINGEQIPNLSDGNPNTSLLVFSNSNGQIPITYTASSSDTPCSSLPGFDQCPLLVPTDIPIEPAPAGCGEGTISSTCDELVYESPADIISVEAPDGSSPASTSYQYIPDSDLPEYSQAPATWVGAEGDDPSATSNGTTVQGNGGSGSVIVGNYTADPAGPLSGSTGQYIDVATQSDPFSYIMATDCNLKGGDSLDWWDPTTRAWVRASAQGYDPSTKCDTLYVASTTTPDLTDLASATLGVADVPLRATVTLAASSRTANPGSTVKLTALARAVDPAGLSLEIVDLATGTVIHKCKVISSCTVSLTKPPGTHGYQARVMKGASTVALTAVITVRWKTPSLRLTASSTNPSIGETVKLSVTSSTTMTHTGYDLEIIDQTTRAVLISCKSGSSCSVPVRQKSAATEAYEAEVANSSGVIASSTVLGITWSS